MSVLVLKVATLTSILSLARERRTPSAGEGGGAK